MLINNIKNHERTFCQILAELSYHVDPTIVAYVKDRNVQQFDEFYDLFENRIKIESYLFSGSACVFPGVRRWVRGKGKYHQYDETYSAIPDDNLYPRHIWSYLVNGIGYSGPSWKRNNLNQFELAHIYTHKEKELKVEKEFFVDVGEDLQPHGDFTCAGNVVLLPKGVVRPTDTSVVMKSIFYKRYIDLYGEDTLNGRKGFKHHLVPDWYDSLRWNAPILPHDWKEKAGRLIDYRTKNIKNILLKKAIPPV